MARINVEQRALSDPRYRILGILLGAPEALAGFVGIGLMVNVWNECQERGVHTLTAGVVNAIARSEGGARFLIEAELASTTYAGRQPVRLEHNCGAIGSTDALSPHSDLTSNTKIRIKGTRGRIEWLEKRRNDGQKGGRPRKRQSVRPLVNLPQRTTLSTGESVGESAATDRTFNANLEGESAATDRDLIENGQKVDLPCKHQPVNLPQRAGEFAATDRTFNANLEGESAATDVALIEKTRNDGQNSDRLCKTLGLYKKRPGNNPPAPAPAPALKESESDTDSRETREPVDTVETTKRKRRTGAGPAVRKLAAEIVARYVEVSEWPANPATFRSVERALETGAADAARLDRAAENYRRDLEARGTGREYRIKPWNWFGRAQRWTEHDHEPRVVSSEPVRRLPLSRADRELERHRIPRADEIRESKPPALTPEDEAIANGIRERKRREAEVLAARIESIRTQRPNLTPAELYREATTKGHLWD